MIAVMIHARSAPPRPYHTPLYKKGLRTNASLPPTSFVTSISERRFWMSSRMVLPTITSTPSASTAVAITIARPIAAKMAFKRSTQPVSSCTTSTEGSSRIDAARLARFSVDAYCASGRTMSACGSGFSLSASIASPNPDSRLNSFRPSSAVINCTSATSRRCRMRSAICFASLTEVGRFRNTEMSSARFHSPVARCAFETSTCRQVGSARAMPITSIVSSVENLC